MARPRQFEEDEVREAIMRVFWQKGYEATSMQDLVEATGLLKGSLYGAFGDKRALYLAALEHYDRNFIQAGVDQLGLQGTPREKIARLFDSVIESINTGVFAGGCLLCNASVEMAPVDENIRRVVQGQINRLRQAIERALGSAVTGALSTDSVSALVVSAYFGTRVLAKSGLPVKMIEDARDQCLELIAT